MSYKLAIILLIVYCGLTIAAPQTYQQIFKTPLGVPYQGKPIDINRKILSTEKVPFVEHIAGKASWLGMNFDYQYVKPIFDSVNSTEVPLLTRGEAHITVISPPEFALLDTIGISIEEINHIALKLNIQSSKVKLVCLGKEDVIVGGLRQVVYQLIAESSDLVEIRRKIFQLYVTKGGNTALFDPESFWPHITVGYMSKDVFIEQGIYKGSNVCYSRIRMKN